SIGPMEIDRPPIAAPTPPAPHLANSSENAALMKVSRKPSPPYFSDMPKPQTPSAPTFWCSSHGTSPASSHLSAYGVTSAATNLRTVSRNARRSSVSNGFFMAPLLLSRPHVFCAGEIDS